MDEAVKVRLVGALVLIALLALAWPFLFDDAEDIRLSKESQIPSPPVVQEWQPAEHKRPAEDQIGWPKQVAQSQPSTDGIGLEPSKETISEPQTNTEQRKTPELRAAWVVRVASLGDSDNAKKLVAKLINDGYRAFSKSSITESGEMTRVYVGPKFDKRKADSIKLKIDRSYSVKSMVVPYDPGNS
ncbi:MAG: SPOR domain-containing protein [Pseudomonadota bacterium]